WLLFVFFQAKDVIRVFHVTGVQTCALPISDDVTDEVHPGLVAAAIRVARAIEMPVVGVDFMVRSPHEPDYAFIEANERPGLANHEPQPTAQRFVDLLFPQTIPASARRAAESARAG